MIVLRQKRFADNEVPEPGETIEGKSPQLLQQQQPQSMQDLVKQQKELQLQQMRLQKQKVLIQHQKQQMQIKEGLAKSRELMQRQKMAQTERQDDSKQALKAKKLEMDDEKGRDNTSLYKTRSKGVAPVPMKV